MYLKVVNRKAGRNNTIKYSCVDTDNNRVIFDLIGTEPYCFIRIDDEHLINSNYMGGSIKLIVNEGFITLEQEPCYTLYTNTSFDLRRLSDQLGSKIILSGDVKREIATSIKYNISNYIVIPSGLAKAREIHYARIRNMTKEERVEVVFDNTMDHVSWLDIEAISGDGGFPEPKKLGDETVCVVVDTEVFLLLKNVKDIDLVKKRYKHILYKQEVNVRIFFGERRLIEELYLFMFETGYQVIVAWNSDFDEEWLEEKTKLLKLDLDWSIFQWLNIQQCYSQNLGFTTSMISLKDAFTLVYQYKRDKWKYLPKTFKDYFKIEIDEFNLPIPIINKSSMVYKYLKMRKSQSGAKVAQMYEGKRFNDLTFYNVSDVFDMIALRDVAGIGGYIAQAEALELLRYNDVFNHTRKIDPTPLRLAIINKIASKSMNFKDKDEKKNKKGNKDEEIGEGAIVHEPDKGKILNDVFVFDFSRFYISIILALRVSPENVGDNPVALINILPDGTKLDKPMFFLEALAYYLIQAREGAEIGLAQAKKDKNDNLEAHFGNMRMSYKDLTSGLWGYISADFSRYFAIHVPRLILGESRNKNIQLKDYLNTEVIATYIFRVVYGDTDSSFAQLMGRLYCERCNSVGYRFNDRSCSNCFHPMKVLPVKREDINFDLITKVLNKFLKEICDKAGYPVPIEVKPEKLFDKLYLVAKKFYYGRVVWEGEFLKDHSYYVKGMQTIRGDHSQFAKDFQYSVIMTHLNVGEDGLYKLIKDRTARFYSILNEKMTDGILEIARPVSFRTKPYTYIYNENGTKKKKTGYTNYAMSAERWNDLVGEHNEDEYLGARSKAKMIAVSSVNIEGLSSRDWLVFVNPSRIDWRRVQLNENALLGQNILSQIGNILSAMGKSKREIKLMIRGERRDNGLGL